MEREEIKLGEVFQCGIVKLKCVERGGSCKGCIVSEELADCTDMYIFLGYCGKKDRTDGKDVKFVRVDD